MILEYSKDSILNLSKEVLLKRNEIINGTLTLDDFINLNIETAKDLSNKEFQGQNTLYKNPYPRDIKVAPSVAKMKKLIDENLNEIQKIDRSISLTDGERLTKKKTLLRDMIRPERIIHFDTRPDIWWGDTIKGINFRPGLLNNDRTLSIPTCNGGQKVHLLAGGDTGQGKSVLMNSIITNLLTEYAPWELQLYMNDGKKQEYAIYGQTPCPQIKNIAITEEAAYHVSTYEYFNKEMVMLNSIFSSIGSGINKLAALRNFLDLHIPSNLFIHDEFSQMKALGTGADGRQVDKQLQSISKLGRSVCYYLFPTSQTLKNDLESDTAKQFALGFAVGTNENNSNSLIGNGKADGLKKKKGYCISNNNRTGENNEIDNKEYKVAFCDTEDDKGKLTFMNILSRIADQSKEINYPIETNVYDELQQESYDDLNLYISKGMETHSEPMSPSIPRLTYVPLGIETKYRGGKDSIGGFDLNFDDGNYIILSSNDNNKLQYLIRLMKDTIEQILPNRPSIHIVNDPTIFNKSLTDEDNSIISFTKNLNIQGNINYVKNVIDLISFNQECKARELEPNLNNYFEYKFKSINIREFFTEQEIGYLKDKDYLEDIKDNIENEEYMKNTFSRYTTPKEFNQYISYVYQLYENFEIQSLAKDCYLDYRDLPVQFLWLWEPFNNEGFKSRNGYSNEFLEFLRLAPKAGIYPILICKREEGMDEICKECKHIISGYENKFLMRKLELERATVGIKCKYTFRFNPESEENTYFKEFRHREL